ncbi:MAG: phenylalanyl-tRNA synthetase beta chain, partial [Alphaproteobacteria bacterium]|nr:phenylalanyl-tRNA synthetase beta chain [Alphaproteobacteria bacterium]
AFIVDQAVKAGDITRAAQGADRKLIAGVNVFDVYEGKGIDPGKKSVAIAVTIQPREKTMTDEEIDALAVLAAAGVPAQSVQVVPGGPGWFHPGRSGTLQMGPQTVLGHFGELHPQALEALDAEGPMVAFEVILERVPEPKAKATRAKPVLELSPFQPVERDFAFIVDQAVKAGDITRAAQGADRKLIAGVNVFDVYEGKGIDPGKKSIAIAVTIQPREKTMTDEEIEALAGKIVAEVSKKTGGTLRS